MRPFLCVFVRARRCRSNYRKPLNFCWKRPRYVATSVLDSCQHNRSMGADKCGSKDVLLKGMKSPAPGAITSSPAGLVLRLNAPFAAKRR